MEKKQRAKGKIRLTKEQRKKWIRSIVVTTGISAIPYLVIPEWRAWIMENPGILLLYLVQVAVVFLPLMLGAYLLLKWVRAGKEEEEES